MANIILSLGNSCNNSCIYCECPLPDHHLKLGDRLNESIILHYKDSSLTFEEYIAGLERKILAAEEKYASYTIDGIDVSGGEPLIQKNIFPLLDYLTERFSGVEIMICTNGRMLLYKELFEKLLQYPVSFDITFHSIVPEIFDRITQVQGSFSQTMRALQRIKEYSVKTRLVTQLNALNIDYFREYLEFVTRNFPGIRNLVLDTLTFFPRAKQHFETLAIPYTELWKRASKHLMDLSGHFDSIFFNVVPLCCFPEELYSLNSVKVHFDTSPAGLIRTHILECEECLAADTCQGVPMDYLLLYGDMEFKRITSETAASVLREKTVNPPPVIEPEAIALYPQDRYFTRYRYPSPTGTADYTYLCQDFFPRIVREATRELCRREYLMDMESYAAAVEKLRDFCTAYGTPFENLQAYPDLPEIRFYSKPGSALPVIQLIQKPWELEKTLLREQGAQKRYTCISLRDKPLNDTMPEMILEPILPVEAIARSNYGHDCSASSDNYGYSIHPSNMHLKIRIHDSHEKRYYTFGYVLVIGAVNEDEPLLVLDTLQRVPKKFIKPILASLQTWCEYKNYSGLAYKDPLSPPYSIDRERLRHYLADIPEWKEGIPVTAHIPGKELWKALEQSFGVDSYNPLLEKQLTLKLLHPIGEYEIIWCNKEHKENV
ncbi:MAG: radical SAM protein [bacterium]|nr:radical SAM protein [bacterium]